MDIVTTGVAFLIGVATGAGVTYFADKYTDKRRNKEKNKQDASLFEKIWNQHLPLLKEMKEDLENPDLILMDLSLPVKDGWEATKELKNDSKTKNIPIIALTANALDSDKKQALEAGCDDYETKPIKFQQLLSKMNALMKN